MLVRDSFCTRNVKMHSLDHSSKNTKRRKQNENNDVNCQAEKKRRKEKKRETHISGEELNPRSDETTNQWLVRIGGMALDKIETHRIQS